MISKDDIDRMVELVEEYKELYDETDGFVVLEPWTMMPGMNAGVHLIDEETVRQQAHELEAEVEQNENYIYFKYKDVYIYCVRTA